MNNGELRQGDYLPDVRHLVVGTPVSDPRWRATWFRIFVRRRTPIGVVVLSQCCDLARQGSGDVLVAAVTALDGQPLADARSGRAPRFAPIDVDDRELFADFGCIGVLTLDAARAQRRVALDDEGRRRLFAGRIARRYSRFAYPDDAQDFLQRLRRQIRSKATSANSPLGQCLSRIVTIRVSNDTGWDAPAPWELNITFVLEDGELPSADAVGAYALADATISKVAAAIAAKTPGSKELGDLWQQLAELLVADAFAKSANGAVSDAVGEAVEESAYTYDRYRRSADIDVDDLSDAADT